MLKRLLMAVLSSFLFFACSSGDSSKGDQLFAKGEYQEAIAAYDNYLSTRPKNVHALYNRGRSYEELGEFANAQKDFLAALEQDPKNTQVLLSLSNLFQKQKNHNSALLYADYAAQVPGAPAMAFFMKGRALHQLGNTKEAMKDYSTAISMDKNFGQAFYYRGMLKIATKNKSGGCEDIRNAIKLNFSDAQAALDQYCK